MAIVPRKEQLTGDVTAGEFKKGLDMLIDAVSSIDGIGQDTKDKAAKALEDLATKEDKGVAQKLDDKLRSSILGVCQIKNAVDVINALDTQTLESLGVKYSIAENGYICFGKLFGGLIIQWGYTPKEQKNENKFATFGVAFNSTPIVLGTPSFMCEFCVYKVTTTQISFSHNCTSSTYFRYLVIGN